MSPKRVSKTWGPLSLGSTDGAGCLQSLEPGVPWVHPLTLASGVSPSSWTLCVSWGSSWRWGPGKAGCLGSHRLRLSHRRPSGSH